jgi:drug/metabolite transporter (DMT)-like permease
LSARPGDAPTLICALLFALQILFLGRFVSTSDFRQLQLLQMAGAAVLGAILTPMLEISFIQWNSNLVLFLFITGVLATALAFYVQARAQRLTTSNHAALIFSLEPFFAALLDYWTMGQIMTKKEWAGGILILAGILFSELRLSSRKSEAIPRIEDRSQDSGVRIQNRNFDKK